MNRTLTQIATVIFCLTCVLSPPGSEPLLPGEPAPDIKCHTSFDCPTETYCDRRDNQCYEGLGHGTA